MGLTINYTPGYVFSDTELLDGAKLNALGNPTIDLEGSVGTLALADNSVTTAKILDGNVTLAKLAPALFYTSALTAISDPATVFTHGLGAVPFLVRVVLVAGAVADAAAYAQNDEVGVESFFTLLLVAGTGATGDCAVPLFTVQADATSVRVLQSQSTNHSANRTPRVMKKSDGTVQAVTLADWKLKCYAALI